MKWAEGAEEEKPTAYGYLRVQKIFKDILINDYFSSCADWKRTKASPFGIGLSRKPRKDSQLYWEQDLVKNLVVDKNIYYYEQNQKNLLEPFVFLLPDQLSFRRILNLNPTQTKRFINHYKILDC